MIYFTIATLWGYSLFKDSYYLTPLLLGKGDMLLTGRDYPVHPFPLSVKIYYLGTMGYHFYSLLYHAFAKARNDFIEMFLHHSVTILLYGFSYYCSFTVSGAIIMYLHDIADVFTSGIRAFAETTYSKISVFFAIMMTVSWFYTRILVFPLVIYESTFATVYADSNDIITRPLMHLKLFLIILQVLHVYWFYVLLLALNKYLSKGKIADN